MSVIKFKNYRLSYDQTLNIYKLIKNDGYAIVSDLGKLCDGLKEKWKGEDAPIHINKLLKIQASLKKQFEDSISMITEVSDRIVKIHEIINRISGSLVVPDYLKNVFDSEKVKEDVDDSKSYSLVSLKDEYNLLCEITNNYLLFKNNYAEKYDEFFDNWEEDPEKERIENLFDEFLNNMDNYTKTLEETRQALYEVASNVEQVLEG